MKVQRTLIFDLEGEAINVFPSNTTIAQGVYDGLPKEWYDYQDDGDYKVVNIVGVAQSSNLTGLMKENGRLDAELEQERKLTAHLEGQVTIGHRKYNDANELNKNLVQKNDNQVEIIKNLQAKYDDSLIDWKHVSGLRDEAVSRADRNYDALEEADKDVERLRGEVKTLQMVNGTLIKQCERRDDDLKVCQETNRQKLGQLIADRRMVTDIVAAISTAGHSTGGFDDDDLSNVEGHLDDIKSATAELADTVDTIRTGR